MNPIPSSHRTILQFPFLTFVYSRSGPAALGCSSYKAPEGRFGALFGSVGMSSSIRQCWQDCCACDKFAGLGLNDRLRSRLGRASIIWRGDSCIRSGIGVRNRRWLGWFPSLAFQRLHDPEILRHGKRESTCKVVTMLSHDCRRVSETCSLDSIETLQESGSGWPTTSTECRPCGTSSRKEAVASNQEEDFAHAIFLESAQDEIARVRSGTKSAKR